MPSISVLPPQLADMIAAGEVVERPASVVKELMENALDAGAKSITVELRGGGATYIRVTDDGCGMEPEDAGNCFLRHATSKLKSAHGLEAIATMGFRGEALAAIAAVSRVELVTRPGDRAEGTRVEVEGGELMDMRPAGGPAGTSMTVRELFYNTPARLKFMKSDRVEGGACAQTALRVALGRPDISVRCVRDGKELFFTPGDGKPASAVYALLGRETALSMLPVEGENEGVSVGGFASSPAAGRGNRSLQFFFVNGRSIRSPLMQAALEQAYKNTLLTGRFPACVLYIRLSPGEVDVNVHPTKSEVKFSGEKRVFDAVYYAVLSALQGESRPMEMELSPGTAKRLEAVPATTPAPGKPARGGEPPRMEVRSPVAAYRASSPVRVPAGTLPPIPRRAASPERATLPKPEREAFPAPESRPDPRPVPGQQSLFPEEERAAGGKARLVGEVMRAYIVAERGDTMLLIDKHAAHERMNFDRLKASGREIMAQSLLAPVPWRPSEAEREALEENRALLSELGFELESMGRDDIVVRAVPDSLDPAQAVAALEEICQKLRRGSRDLARDEALQTIACRSAIKAGWDTDPAELQALVDKVASGEIKYCPHGRPVAVTLTRQELDKQFRRIV